jgi:glutathionyl-hydroquinone reductase
MSKEIPSVNFEKNKDKFKDIRELCKDDKEFDDVVMKVSLLEVIIGQVNQIFMSSLYNENATALVNSANSSIESLQQSVVDTYIKNSLEVKKLMPIPDISELSTWVEEIHYDIARQLYAEGFCDAVIYPALQTVTSSVIEFAEEEARAANGGEKDEE